MIQMVSVRGPSAGYDPTNGIDVTIGNLEEIHQSSGKMVMAQAVSSCEFLVRADSVSGNIVTLKCFKTNASVGHVAVTSSTVLGSVEIVLVADGY